MNKKIIALAPFSIFLGLFSLLHYVYANAPICKDNFALFSAIIAIISAFFTFNKGETWEHKVQVFLEGSSKPLIMYMCLIFYASTVFTTLLTTTGGIDAAVKICLSIIPAGYILPGLFVIASLFSFTVGTSMGAIAAFMPIAVTIATTIGLNPSLMAATIVCGAMFGDNLSVLSDTSIAAVNITRCATSEKLWLNSKIAALPFFVTIALLIYQNSLLNQTPQTIVVEQITLLDQLQVLPYIFTFICACCAVDILTVLILGSMLTILIGLGIGTINFMQVINLTFDGFYASKGMVNVFMLVFFLAGLAHIITYNGGLVYILEQLETKIKQSQQAEYSIFLLITIINSMIAINTISILIVGPIAKKITTAYHLSTTKTACILDIGSCVSQGLLPYSPQILLAASIAHVSPLSLFPYLYYQYFLGASLVYAIFYGKKNNTN